MSRFSTASFADVSLHFGHLSTKPLRLPWHADIAVLRPAQPSKFAAASLFRKSFAFDFSPPRAVLVTVGTLADSRFYFEKPVALPAIAPEKVPAQEAVFIAINAPAPVPAAIPAPPVEMIRIAAPAAAPAIIAAETPAAPPVPAALAPAPEKTVSAEKPAAAKAPAAPQKRATLTLKTKVEIVTVPVAKTAEASATTPVKLPSNDSKAPVSAAASQSLAPVAAAPRRRLSLKEKVEMPTMLRITRTSTAEELAAAFKTEMKLMTERSPEDMSAGFNPAAVVVEKKRSSTLAKSLQELAAEAAAQATVLTAPSIQIDLASAFKREMQALMNEQAKMTAEASLPHPSAIPAPVSRGIRFAA